jgi:uncharacterized coiled-coil protein SlyX
MSAPEIIASSEYIGNSLTKINNNTTNLFNRVNVLEATTTTQNSNINVLNQQLTTSGAVLQKICVSSNLTSITNATHGGPNPADVGIGPVTVTRKSSGASRLLIEISGGFYDLDSNKVLETFIYGQLNNTGPIIDINGYPIEYVVRGGSGRHRANHIGRCLYSFPLNVTTINIYVYARVGTSSSWNSTVTVVPFSLTVTEII